jgi:PleD family two-component response regulator
MAKRIMIIEDDVIELNRLSLLLDLKGFEVCPLNHSYRFLTEVAKCNPDLILLDSVLSEIDSTLITRTLKSLDPVRNIPLVLIAGKDYENYTFAYNTPEKGNLEELKTADLNSLIRDIELKMAS